MHSITVWFEYTKQIKWNGFALNYVYHWNLRETLEIRIQVSVDTQNCLDVMEFSNLLESFFVLISNFKKIHDNFPYVQKTVSSKLD